MGSRFTKDAKTVVVAARGEAEALGSPTVEAEHLLLALARRGEPALARAGLDHDAVVAALEAETAHSLSVAGVTWSAPPGRAATAMATAPRFAASAKLALERSLPAALERGENRLTSKHVLLGVLRADVGTVPRALALAGIDRRALAAAV
jgi:ATP-dependent Clp protease ATP-binding subunit ClpA